MVMKMITNIIKCSDMYYDWDIIENYNKKEFQEWWNKNKDNFTWFYSYYLCEYCHKYFEIWWDPKRFQWSWSNDLKRFCSDYKDIWEKDYLFHKIKGDIE